jgi:hypothetical protein
MTQVKEASGLGGLALLPRRWGYNRSSKTSPVQTHSARSQVPEVFGLNSPSLTSQLPMDGLVRSERSGHAIRFYDILDAFVEVNALLLYSCSSAKSLRASMTIIMTPS